MAYTTLRQCGVQRVCPAAHRALPAAPGRRVHAPRRALRRGGAAPARRRVVLHLRRALRAPLLLHEHLPPPVRGVPHRGTMLLLLLGRGAAATATPRRAARRRRTSSPPAASMSSSCAAQTPVRARTCSAGKRTARLPMCPAARAAHPTTYTPRLSGSSPRAPQKPRTGHISSSSDHGGPAGGGQRDEQHRVQRGAGDHPRLQGAKHARLSRGTLGCPLKKIEVCSRGICRSESTLVEQGKMILEDPP